MRKRVTPINGWVNGEGKLEFALPYDTTETILKAYEWLKSSKEKSICVSTKEAGVILITKL